MLNLDQARVVEPILTEIVRGFSQNNMIRQVLFPDVPVRTRKGKVIKFGKEGFVPENTSRAPGGKVNYVTVGFDGDEYNLLNDGLGWKLPMEDVDEAREVPHIDLITEAMQVVTMKTDLGEELRASQLATTIANYAAGNAITPTSTDKWDQSTANVLDQIRLGKEQIRAGIGRKPNTMVLGPKAFDILQENQGIRDQFKYTSSKSITLDMVAEYFQIEKVVIGEAVQYDPTSDDFLDVWNSDCLLAYVNREGKSRRLPSYGYTYRHKDSPAAGPQRWDADERSWKGDLYWEQRALLTSDRAGFLIKSVI